MKTEVEAMHRLGALLGVLVLLPLRSLLAAPVTAEPHPATADAVASALAIERTLVEEDLQRYEDSTRRRNEATVRLAQLYQTLDAAIAQRGADSGTERLERVMAELDRAEIDRAGWLTAERMLLERIRDRQRRVILLDQALAELQGRQDKQLAGVLSGTWDLVLMPLEQRGTCVLKQEGTLVSGTYQLDGGFSGSLQGTLVNRKVLLHRIDSRLGKLMELEGYLSGDGKYIRGTWLNYELAGSNGSTGHWSAERRSSKGTSPSGER